jgi:hypothetical protein
VTVALETVYAAFFVSGLCLGAIGGLIVGLYLGLFRRS